jgi:hypothetical protein
MNRKTNQAAQWRKKMLAVIFLPLLPELFRCEP